MIVMFVICTVSPGCALIAFCTLLGIVRRIAFWLRISFPTKLTGFIILCLVCGWSYINLWCMLGLRKVYILVVVSGLTTMRDVNYG